MKIASLFKACLVGAALVASANSANAEEKLREFTITLSSSSLGVGAPRVAKEMGLFEKHGLSARIIPMDSGNTALTAVISKSADGALAGSGTVITAIARGQNLVPVVNGYGAFATTMVISKATMEKLGVSLDAPTKDRLKAVDGLLIGTPEPTAGSTLGFKGAAATVGAAMRFTYMAQTAMPAALEKGVIDGYLASAPYWAVSVASGRGVVWLSGPKGDLPPGTVNVSSTQLQMLREVAEKDPDLIKRVQAVFDDLHKAIDEHPDVVKAATARVYTDIDPKLLDIVFPYESAAWNAKLLTAQDWAGEIEFVKNSGTPIPGIEKVTPESLMLK